MFNRMAKPAAGAPPPDKLALYEKLALSRNLTGGLFGGSSAVWAFLTRTTVFPRAGTAESAPELTSWVQVIPEPSTIFAGKLG